MSTDQADVAPGDKQAPDRPKETEAERADRNFVDLLQELRVAQTGVQILFAFLLTLPLQSRFPILDSVQRGVYVSCLIATTGATVCLIAPVAYHRALFQRGMKSEVVKMASRYASLGLVFLGLAVVFAVHLVFSVVVGRTAANIVGVCLALVLILVWAVLPLRLRTKQPMNGNGNNDGPAGD